MLIQVYSVNIYLKYVPQYATGLLWAYAVSKTPGMRSLILAFAITKTYLHICDRLEHHF